MDIRIKRVFKIIDFFLFFKDCSIFFIFFICFWYNNNRDILFYKFKKYWRYCFMISLKRKNFVFWFLFLVNCFYCGIVFLINKFVDGMMIVVSYLVFLILKWGLN